MCNNGQPATCSKSILAFKAIESRELPFEVNVHTCYQVMICFDVVVVGGGVVVRHPLSVGRIWIFPGHRT